MITIIYTVSCKHSSCFNELTTIVHTDCSHCVLYILKLFKWTILLKWLQSLLFSIVACYLVNHYKIIKLSLNDKWNVNFLLAPTVYQANYNCYMPSRRACEKLQRQMEITPPVLCIQSWVYATWAAGSQNVSWHVVQLYLWKQLFTKINVVDTPFKDAIVSLLGKVQTLDWTTGLTYFWFLHILWLIKLIFHWLRGI